MGANPEPLVRLFNEFAKHESQAVMGGIYANKSGYHNTRANHVRNRPGDYSIQAAADKRGPSDKAAALDITFKDAQRSDFRTIAKYTSRLINAMKRKDARLYYRGRAVVRECFGNSDHDREVEGWSLYRGYALSSDPSHLWHIHISFHREFVTNWNAVKGVLDVLLDRKGGSSKPKDWFTLASKKDLRDVIREEVGKAVWSHRIEVVHNGKKAPASTHLRWGRHQAREALQQVRQIPEQVWYGFEMADPDSGEKLSAATFLRYAFGWSRQNRARLNRVLESLSTLFGKVDSHNRESRAFYEAQMSETPEQTMKRLTSAPGAHKAGD